MMDDAIGISPVPPGDGRPTLIITRKDPDLA